jgi:hypothetical protein
MVAVVMGVEDVLLGIVFYGHVAPLEGEYGIKGPYVGVIRLRVKEARGVWDAAASGLTGRRLGDAFMACSVAILITP